MATKITKSELMNIIRESLQEELSVSNYRRRAIREDVNDEQEVELTGENLKKSVAKAIIDKGGKAAANIAEIVFSSDMLVQHTSIPDTTALCVKNSIHVETNTKRVSGDQNAINEIAASVVKAIRDRAQRTLDDAQRTLDLINKHLQ